MNEIPKDKSPSKSKTPSKAFVKNPFGHYRKLPDASEFGEYFERREGDAVLGEFLNSTASWVHDNFALIELEVHQAATIGRVAREKNQKLDYAKVREEFPRLAILATDGDMQEILEGTHRPKDVTADMFARVLHREPSSIKRWAQGKKQ